jgi:transmembrane E3 ubiquitin-protein ligase
VPFLTSSNDTFINAMDLISNHLEALVEKHTSYLSVEEDDDTFWMRSLQCDMIMFISVLPSPGISSEALALYESEMRYPTGQRIVRPPPMELSGIMYSPDCGTALEWRDERAVKVEKFWHAGRTVGIVAGLISGLQCWWVLKEMGERGSPSVLLFNFMVLIIERE